MRSTRLRRIAVVNAKGNLLAFARQGIALIRGIDVAINEARTAPRRER